MPPENLEPFFSVVIPVYNKEKFVGRAIRSVLSQEFTNFELIIVCDPSTDDSYAKVAAFNDDRIRVFQRENLVQAVTLRNLGIKNARSEWIGF
ncbi:hypothetical protein HSBAA_63630 [Vreelandella sulfidaeris]|uniref:Glycosyltransferase 2-like domain-containing protein n=1 Tax=Vreelandella sulfidaeris TaxID=115553 RepID=A0A455UH73_9GAMM|nr:hypothetical protein HSBAA_63630 [Halomonas sulfidaeris]